MEGGEFVTDGASVPKSASERESGFGKKSNRNKIVCIAAAAGGCRVIGVLSTVRRRARVW